jgi:hypothetical protein
MSGDYSSLIENQAEVDNLMDSLEVHLGSKKFSELTVYSIAEVGQDFIRQRELQFYQQVLDQNQPLYEIAMDIRNTRAQLIQNFATTRKLSQELQSGKLEGILEELIKEENGLNEQRSSLMGFKKAYYLSDEALKQLIDESVPVDEEFFVTLRMVIDNLKIRSSLAKHQFLAKRSAEHQITSDEALLLTQKLALRKLGDHFVKHIDSILPDQQFLDQSVKVLSGAPEEIMSKVNEAVTKSTHWRLQNSLKIYTLSTRDQTSTAFEESAWVFSFFFDFIMRFSRELFVKDPKSELEIQHNIDLIFSAFEPHLQRAVGYYSQNESLVVDDIRICESILSIKHLIKRIKPLGMKFLSEKILDQQLNECIRSFRKQLSAFFKKMLGAKELLKHIRFVDDNLKYFAQLLQFRQVMGNEEFADAIYSHLGSVLSDLRKQPSFGEFKCRFEIWVREDVDWSKLPSYKKYLAALN